MSDLRATLAETLRAHTVQTSVHKVWCSCGNWEGRKGHAEHVADALLGLSGVAVTQLPERRDGCWPVDLADDDFSVWRISMRRERDGAYVNGSRISWGALQIDLSGDHSRKLAEALLAVVLSEGETR